MLGLGQRPLNNSSAKSVATAPSPVSNIGILMYQEMSTTPPFCAPYAVKILSVSSLLHSLSPTMSSPYMA